MIDASLTSEPFSLRRTRRVVVLVAAFSILMLAPMVSGQSERATRSYFTANGMLNRGLYEQAAAEYRVFLEEADSAQTEQVNIARYGLAVSLAHIGEPQRAIEQLEQVDTTDRFAFGFEAGFLEAQLRYSDGQFKAASRLFRTLARSRHARAAQAGSLWVECLYRIEKLPAVVAAWDDLSQRDDFAQSDLSRASLYAGLSLGILGEDALAVKVLDSLLKRDDDVGLQSQLATANALVRLGELDEAKVLYAQLAPLDEPRWALPATLGLARLARTHADPKLAVNSIEDLRERLPSASDNQDLTLELGVSLIEIGRHQEGRRLLDQLDPGAHRSYWIAKSRLRQGHTDRAIDALKSALEQFPETDLRLEMLYDLGVGLYEQGEIDRALEAFDRVAAERPDSPIADQSQLAGAKSLMALERYDEARERASQIKQASLRTDAQLLLAQAQSLSGDPERGVKNLRRWLRDHPEHASSDQARYQLAMSYAALGELTKAEAAIEPLLTGGIPEALAPGLLVMGDAAANAQKWDRAEHWYALALEHDSAQHSLAQLKLGLAMAQQSRHQPAAELFEQASSATDAAIAHHALFELGQSQLMLGDDTSAADSFARLLDNAPDSEFASYAMLHMGEIAERANEWPLAAAWYDKAAKAAPDTRSDALRARARALLGAGDFDSLIEKASQADDPELKAYAAIALARRGECDRAAPRLKRLIRSNDLAADTKPLVMYELLWCAKQAGDTDEALQLVELLAAADSADQMALYAALEGAAIELDRGDLEASERWIEHASAGVRESKDGSLLAVFDYRAARLDAARNNHRQVVERLGEFHTQHAAHELIANAGVLLGDALLFLDRPRDAASAYERAAETPDKELRPAVLLRLGDAHAQAQSWDQSRTTYETFLRESPDSEFEFEARFGLAWALEHLGQFDEAREHYAHVVEHHTGPTAARAQFQIGECLFAQEDYEQAVRELLRVDILYDAPQWNAAALYEAGRAFEQLRKFGEAREQFREVIERFGQTQWAPLAQERLDQLSKNR